MYLRGFRLFPRTIAIEVLIRLKNFLIFKYTFSELELYTNQKTEDDCFYLRSILKKKNNKEIESIKEELLASIIEIVSEDNSELNEAVWNAKQPSEAIAVINKYEAVLEGENKKKINIVGKQEQLLKKFNDSENLFQIYRPKPI